MSLSKKNPFHSHLIVSPALFTGRREQVHQVIRRLAQIKEGMSTNFVVQGDRGIGKTAFAKFSMFLAQKKDPKLGNLNFLTTYYAVEKGQPFQFVLQSSLNLLTDQLPKTAIDRLKVYLGDFFKNGKFTIGAFGHEAVGDQTIKTVQESFVLRDQVISILTHIAKGIREDKKTYIPNKIYDGVLIVLDDIHNTKELSVMAQIFRNISTTLDVNGLNNISFMIIGHKKGIRQFFDGDVSIKHNFDSISLGIMPDTEAREIFKKGFEQSQVNYNKSFLTERVKNIGGYPYSIHVLGQYLIDIDDDDDIDQKDWEEAISKTLTELQSKDFSNMYNFEGPVTLREKILNFLAFQSQPISKKELAKFFSTTNIYTRSCLPKLKSLGAIKEDTDTGHIDMQSTLFQSVVRLHLTLKLLKEKKAKPHKVSRKG